MNLTQSNNNKGFGMTSTIELMALFNSGRTGLQQPVMLSFSSAIEETEGDSKVQYPGLDQELTVQDEESEIQIDHTISHHPRDLLHHHLICLFPHPARNHLLVHRLEGFKPKHHLLLLHASSKTSSAATDHCGPKPNPTSVISSQQVSKPTSASAD